MPFKMSLCFIKCLSALDVCIISYLYIYASIVFKIFEKNIKKFAIIGVCIKYNYAHFKGKITHLRYHRLA